jgi:hypothetical protein
MGYNRAIWATIKFARLLKTPYRPPRHQVSFRSVLQHLNIRTHGRTDLCVHFMHVVQESKLTLRDLCKSRIYSLSTCITPLTKHRDVVFGPRAFYLGGSRFESRSRDHLSYLSPFPRMRGHYLRKIGCYTTIALHTIPSVRLTRTLRFETIDL